MPRKGRINTGLSRTFSDGPKPQGLAESGDNPRRLRKQLHEPHMLEQITFEQNNT